MSEATDRMMDRLALIERAEMNHKKSDCYRCRLGKTCVDLEGIWSARGKLLSAFDTADSQTSVPGEKA